VNPRRRLTVLTVGLVALAGAGAPVALAHDATETATDHSVAVPVSRTIGCAWLDALDLSVCLSG
jgi:hypothetical protein